MCECIKKWEEKMIGFVKNGKKATKGTFLSAAFVGTNFSLQTTSEMELEIPGQKKKIIQNLLHTYCPFCGEKYPQ